MTGLGLGLGISSGGIGGGAVSFLYLMTQDGDILISQKNRGEPSSPAFLVYEPNDDITSDTLPEPTELLLSQDSKFLQTQDGRLIAQNSADRPYDRLMSQDDNNMITQAGDYLVSEQVS
tara:strand:+ start:1932 stop:2288 length:357 start_codon:yes stop_codon:yes gene_type:complete